MIQQTEIYKLAQYRRKAGIIQKKESDIFHIQPTSLPDFSQQLVGTNQSDNTVVLEIGHGDALISTTALSSPTVDDPYEFGRIASANALNNVYATGGEPLLASAILGWPTDHIPADVANHVLEGSRALCAEAGILLTTGHRIESAEPFFGLTVTGKVRLNHLKQINMATEGCCLYLTKPLGFGILTTALQKELLQPHEAETALNQMALLNTFGAFLGKLPYVKALTHVSGSGLLGHLIEMAESSGLSADIDFHKVPVLPGTSDYLAQESSPEAAYCNWERFSEKTNELPNDQRLILADPQLSGGLLIAVESRSGAEFEQVAFEHKFHLKSFGQLIEKGEKVVYVR
ncbi:selenide, water dikinase SelD [Larkinella insperata]|uniref:Selenide, water dikinase SelD n=1 Tax=Larkinella insperata TaxID=332158 RepID=A0ABW3Q8E5_9BACT|nr:selenide, water dikinase SelD [Larkinella insperata]